jgi:hypothetical protein
MGPKTRFILLSDCWCGASYRMRGRVCRLQLMLGLASAVILGSESRENYGGILFSQIRDSPNLECRIPVFISPGTGWPSYNPRHLAPFSSPPVTRRDTVEVFDPASTRVHNRKVKVILRLTISQSVSKSWYRAPSWGPWPIFFSFFLILMLLSFSIGAPSLTRGRVCHLSVIVRTESVSYIVACSLVAEETTCPQSCSLAKAVVLSPVYTGVIWQRSTCQNILGIRQADVISFNW